MRAPTPRERAWIDNPRIRSGTTETGSGRADMAVDPSPATNDKNELRDMQKMRQEPRPTTEQGLAKGGKVTHPIGGKRGKDDGVVAVQKGEHVIRKAAVEKYGPARMSAVNRGTATITTKGKR